MPRTRRAVRCAAGKRRTQPPNGFGDHRTIPYFWPPRSPDAVFRDRRCLVRLPAVRSLAGRHEAAFPRVRPPVEYCQSSAAGRLQPTCFKFARDMTNEHLLSGLVWYMVFLAAITFHE